MTTYASDTMTDSNWQPVVAHSPDTGGPVVAHPTAGGTFYIVNGRALCRSAPAGKGVMYYSGAPASADYSVQADIRIFSATGAAGIVGRCSTTASTFYYAYITNDNSQLVLAKMVGGAITSLDVFVSAGFFAAGSTYTIELRMAGTSIKAFVDGVERCDATDSSITAAGRGGIRGITLSDTGTGKHIDTFSVFDASAPPAARRGVSRLTGL